MIEAYLDRLVYLETEGPNAVFAQREKEFQRLPYELERRLLRFVVEGKPTELQDFCAALLQELPELRIPVGRTARSKLRRLKYHGVAAVALVCQAALLGGAPEIECYARSDSAILRIDGQHSEAGIFQVLEETVLGYAALVQQTKSRLRHPAAVRKCVQYISAHTHQNITLEELAAGSEYSKEYVAKLFKKHMGMSVSDYIRKSKIDEAKELLRRGLSCGEVACVLNFSSQSYFIRQFKKETGVTPRLFVNLLKIGPGEAQDR